MRIRRAVLTGTLDVALTNVATEMESVALEDAPVVADGDVLVLVLDPRGANGAPECVHVVAHAEGASTATILRGQEQASGHGAARAHGTGTAWGNNPTPADFGAVGEAKTPIAVNQRVYATVGADGRFDHHNFIFAPGTMEEGVDKHPILVARNIHLANEDELLRITFADGSPSAPAVWEDTVTPTARLDLIPALGALFGGPDVVLSGYEFAFDLDGTIVTTTLTGTWVADLAGLTDLVEAVTADVVAAGAGLVINLLGGVLYLQASEPGVAGSITVDDPGTGDELNLSAATTVAGRLGTVYGLADGIDGGLGAIDIAADPEADPPVEAQPGWYDPDEWYFEGCTTHVCTSRALPHQRAASASPVSAANNGGVAKMTAEHWPPRTGFQEITVLHPEWFVEEPTQLDTLTEALAKGLHDGLSGGLIPDPT